MPMKGSKQKKERRESVISNTVPFNSESMDAEKEYKRANKKRIGQVLLGIAVIVILELGTGGILMTQILEGDYLKRFDREIQIQKTGGIEFEAGTYSGDTDLGILRGVGEFDFNTGTTYSGEWDENQFEGKGTLSIPSEGQYIGEFSDSKKNGHGTFTWADGSVYEGEWKKDKIHGQGTYTGSDGVTYQGTFVDNSFDTGTCEFKNVTGSYHLEYASGNIDTAEITFSDGTLYKGQCTEEYIAGTGFMEFPGEDSYTGSFKEGVRSGNGQYKWTSGDVYDGEWSNDKMAGTGKYTFHNGNTLTGTFSDNSFISGSYHVKNDFGEYNFTIVDKIPTSVSIELESGTKYEGEMDEEGLNGQALISYGNGDKYDGAVKEGKKSGSGTYTWSNGAEYEGEWKDDKMSGKGTYLYPKSESGYALEGHFSEGLPDGNCTYYVTNTEEYETTWSDGECIKVTE